MAPLQRQLEKQWGSQGNNLGNEGLKDTPFARKKEKDWQKHLRGQLGGGSL